MSEHWDNTVLSLSTRSAPTEVSSVLDAAEILQSVTDSDPYEVGVEGFEEQETLEILQYLDRLEEVTTTFLNK